MELFRLDFYNIFNRSLYIPISVADFKNFLKGKCRLEDGGFFPCLIYCNVSETQDEGEAYLGRCPCAVDSY